jgi:hypothetical protein
VTQSKQHGTVVPFCRRDGRLTRARAGFAIDVSHAPAGPLVH